MKTGRKSELQEHREKAWYMLDLKLYRNTFSLIHQSKPEMTLLRALLRKEAISAENPDSRKRDFTSLEISSVMGKVV